MSKDSAAKLIENLRGNEGLKEKFRSAGPSGFQALAREEGCDCTVEEFQAAVKTAAKSIQLTDENLEKMAGGVCYMVSVVVV